MATDRVDLVIVVNGEATTIDAQESEELRAVVELALTRTHNEGRPLDEWELRDSSGAILDLNRKVGSFDFRPGTTLFLSVRAGIGG